MFSLSNANDSKHVSRAFNKHFLLTHSLEADETEMQEKLTCLTRQVSIMKELREKIEKREQERENVSDPYFFFPLGNDNEII